MDGAVCLELSKCMLVRPLIIVLFCISYTGTDSDTAVVMVVVMIGTVIQRPIV